MVVQFPAMAVGRARLYGLCAHLALGASIWGYNIGVLSSVLVHPGWREAMGMGGGADDAARRGAVTGAYYLGTLLSYLALSHPLADWLGRRRAAMVGTVALAAGAAAMAASAGTGSMAAGRWVCGLGAGVVSATVPLYQSEISPAKERGKFVTMNHVGFIAGMAAGLWVGCGMSFWTGEAGDFWGWRVSILIQLAPALVFFSGLPFLPESPRWLVEKGQSDRAERVLDWLYEGTAEAGSVAQELRSITADIDAKSDSRRSTFSLTLSLFSERPLRARLWRAFLLQFLAQMCGAAAMKYYLPSLLQALGLGRRLALMAGAVEMTVKIAMSVVEMWLIDRLGRKACVVGGSAIMGVAMLINGALPLAFPGNVNRASDAACVAFIFVYAMGYSLGLGPAAWVYSSEIFPTTVRARGLNLSASGGAIGSVLVSHIWPVGLAKWGSGIYFFFMVVNFACVPIVWLLYPETKGRSLEDMDSVFAKPGGAYPVSLSSRMDEAIYEEAHGHETEVDPRDSTSTRDDREDTRLLS